VLLAFLWLSPFLEQPSLPGDPMGVVIFALAALVELTAEPLFIMGQLNQYVTLKVFFHIPISTISDDDPLPGCS
ncbi:MAG: oligosaccharide translocation protein RFT1, partial [Proteobacteria bacterium]|nr:oligosaccharide translocation protein RFT1 [Pseudomonadota bacterium]